PTTPSTGTLISEAEAKRIALAHAGVSESEVTFAKVELDWDDGIQEYEVEFYVGYNEYDYEINALTGAILSYDRDMETPRPTTPSTGTLISEAEAKSIALAHAGVSASEVRFLKCELDYDDGISQYEVEFDVGYWEYEYEINAMTGAIIGYDRDN
ncbi:MAG: PepSY domain-containing protein, partial [Eubacteriales bacterium]